jgi:hypothetical protein
MSAGLRIKRQDAAADLYESFSGTFKSHRGRVQISRGAWEITILADAENLAGIQTNGRREVLDAVQETVETQVRDLSVAR